MYFQLRLDHNKLLKILNQRLVRQRLMKTVSLYNRLS
nr:MAG TPA: hypothetical protein [Caudoviricetes sp.]